MSQAVNQAAKATVSYPSDITVVVVVNEEGVALFNASAAAEADFLPPPSLRRRRTATPFISAPFTVATYDATAAATLSLPTMPSSISTTAVVWAANYIPGATPAFSTLATGSVIVQGGIGADSSGSSGGSSGSLTSGAIAGIAVGCTVFFLFVFYLIARASRHMVEGHSSHTSANLSKDASPRDAMRTLALYAGNAGSAPSGAKKVRVFFSNSHFLFFFFA